MEVGWSEIRGICSCASNRDSFISFLSDDFSFPGKREWLALFRNRHLTQNGSKHVFV